MLLACMKANQHKVSYKQSRSQDDADGPRAEGGKATLSDTSAEDDVVYIGVDRGQLIQQA